MKQRPLYGYPNNLNSPNSYRYYMSIQDKCLKSFEDNRFGVIVLSC